MVSQCPKCGQEVPGDSVYCPHCGFGLQPSAKTTQVSAGATLMIVAAVAHLIIFVTSVRALSSIYSWYPALVADSWLVYDQVLTITSFTGFLFGLSTGALALTRTNYTWTLVSAILCTLSGLGSWILSMVIPFSNVWYSFLYYFLPMVTTALIGAVMIFPRKPEFR